METGGRPETAEARASLFALGNGYLGVRGGFWDLPAGNGTATGGTYLNGFYESTEIDYHETFFGAAKTSDTILNVADARAIDLVADGRKLSESWSDIRGDRRELDLRGGGLRRRFVWQVAPGREIEIEVVRFVSCAEKGVFAMSYTATPRGFSPELLFVSTIDADFAPSAPSSDPRAGGGLAGFEMTAVEQHCEDTRLLLIEKTKTSQLAFACAVDHAILGAAEVSFGTDEKPRQVASQVAVKPPEGGPTTITKFVVYGFGSSGSDESIASIRQSVLTTLSKTKDRGYRALQAEHASAFESRWASADIKVSGHAADQASLRFNIFHLLQALTADSSVSIPAKGLTGDGYCGHYFWDAEIFMLPFFLYTDPQGARRLLEFRFHTLNRARERARELGYKSGALYPWRTIGGGESSSFFPASTAQYHINAGVAYAIKSYMDATDDVDFLADFGAEIVFETARIWASIGNYVPHKGGLFCINEVTGPDEYTAMVNNNLYTNAMAQMHLRYANAIAADLGRDHPDVYRHVADKIGLETSELEFWRNAAEQMYLPYDEELGIHPQDDSFLDKAVWDFTNTPKEDYPLLLHYHPLVIYRHQVCKQADVMLAMLLLGDRFSVDAKRRNFVYYEPITTHDSALSAPVYSIIASEIDEPAHAYECFQEVLRVDLDNLHGNTGQGLHMAALAGSWSCVVFGFAGMRAYNGRLSFRPRLPDAWDGCEFMVAFKGRRIKVTMSKAETAYELVSGEPLEISHCGRGLTLDRGASKICRSRTPKGLSRL
ncbi:MAG: hypothetical protein MI755_18745 [Sphingomonadales bacterium]|nr:hypothetical protein [Sphingomonadales bacterium]